MVDHENVISERLRCKREPHPTVGGCCPLKSTREKLNTETDTALTETEAETETAAEAERRSRPKFGSCIDLSSMIAAQYETRTPCDFSDEEYRG